MVRTILQARGFGNLFFSMALVIAIGSAALRMANGTSAKLEKVNTAIVRIGK